MLHYTLQNLTSVSGTNIHDFDYSVAVLGFFTAVLMNVKRKDDLTIFHHSAVLIKSPLSYCAFLKIVLLLILVPLV